MDTATGVNIAALIINIVALFWAIREFFKQRADLQELAKLTSDLQYEVNVLTKELDFSIERLKRTRDLVTGLVIALNSLRQMNRPKYEKLQAATVHNATHPELTALIRIVNDEQLNQAYLPFEEILKNAIWPRMWNEVEYDLGNADVLLFDLDRKATTLLMRVHELWYVSTKRNEKKSHMTSTQND